jgi:hypothetical protein
MFAKFSTVRDETNYVSSRSANCDVALLKLTNLPWFTFIFAQFLVPAYILLYLVTYTFVTM